MLLKCLVSKYSCVLVNLLARRDSLVTVSCQEEKNETEKDPVCGDGEYEHGEDKYSREYHCPFYCIGS